MKALQGRVPGMNITADGNPSGSATVRIRGIGTLNNNDPLYIIDGVPTKAGMHELNGNDIESIQVLKDAASASIYGSRAANGVIVITTKQGKKGQIKINFDASVSASMYQSKMDVLNTEQYGRAMWQAYVNDGENPNGNALGYNYNWGYNANGNPVLYGMSLSKYLTRRIQCLWQIPTGLMKLPVQVSSSNTIFLSATVRRKVLPSSLWDITKTRV